MYNILSNNQTRDIKMFKFENVAMFMFCCAYAVMTLLVLNGIPNEWIN